MSLNQIGSPNQNLLNIELIEKIVEILIATEYHRLSKKCLNSLKKIERFGKCLISGNFKTLRNFSIFFVQFLDFSSKVGV